MKILVSGSSGLVGSALVPALRQAGHQVVALARRPPRDSSEAQWDPAGAPSPAVVEGADAVVHLAGANIAAGRWTAARKVEILNSRVMGTQTIASALARAAQRPRVLVSASAVGSYGNRGDEVLTEQSAPGSGFLAEVARQWESATKAAAEAGVRVVLLRIGMVLSSRGGALPRMALPFRLGVGGRVGSGRQWMSWIALPDLVRLIQWALATEAARGAINAVAPNPTTNAEFTRQLGQALHRPALFPLPAFAVRAAFGEMGTELLLSSQRVQPAAALAGRFSFQYPELRAALEEFAAGKL